MRPIEFALQFLFRKSRLGLSLLFCWWLAAALTAAPTNTCQSATRLILNTGQSLNVSFKATGTGILTCQWLHNGNTIVDGTWIAGATGNALTITTAFFTQTALTPPAAHRQVTTSDF